MCDIKIGQEIFFIYNHYYKQGDELPEIKIGIVFANPQGMKDARGHNIRPKEHQTSRITTRWLHDREIFVTKKDAYVKLFNVIREKIKDHKTGIKDLQGCYHTAENQMAEDLKRDWLDNIV